MNTILRSRANSVIISGLIFVILLCLAVNLIAQSGTDAEEEKFLKEIPGQIKGKVFESSTRSFLEGVNVYLEDTRYGSASGDKGEYMIIGVPAGEYTLIASMIGYKMEKRKVTVKEDGMVHLDIFLEISPLEADAVVVTATRTEKIIKDVPIRTELVTRHQIEKKEAVKLYEALEALSGIRVEQQCSNCNFTMLRMEGLEGGYSQVLIDGMPTFTGLAGVYGLQQLQTGNIQQIEVVKGAGSALYGSDAIGGVVNVITQQPSSIPEYKFGVNVGSYQTNHFFLSGAQQFDNIGLVFSAQRDMEGGIDQTGGELGPNYNDIGKDNYTDRVKSENQSANVRLTVNDVVGDASKLGVFLRASDEFRKGGNLGTWDDPFHPDSEHITTTRYETGMDMEKDLGSDRFFNMNYAFVRHHRNATNGAAWDKAIEGGMVDDDLNFTDAGNAYVSQYGFGQFREDWYPQPFIVTEKLHLADLRYSQVVPGTDHHILGGVQYRRSDLDQSINGDQSDKWANDIGLYAQADIHLNEKTELVAGLRYDMHDSKDNLTGGEYDTKVFNPRVALRYSPNPDLALRGSVGQGYRVPYLFAEDMHLCAAAPRIYKGADLEPEKATSFSVGADIYKAAYRIGLSVFHTMIDDKIDFLDEGSDVPDGYDYRWMNFGEASTQGFDIAFAVLAFDDKAQFETSFTYVNAKYSDKRFSAADGITGWENSDYIPRSPKIAGNFAATFDLPEEIQFYGYAKYTGSMYIDHNDVVEETDGYVTVDFKLSKKFNSKYSLFVGAKNLFDYTQPKRDNADPAYIYAPLYGRIVYSGFDISIR